MRALALLAVLLLLGCSTVPQATRMQVERRLDRPSAGALSLHVEGGSDVVMAGISNAEFEAAVRHSLLASGLFSEILESAPYRLDVVLGDIRLPVAGADMTTVMTVLWSLSRNDTRETVWQALIESQHTAQSGEAFAGVVRVRKATEGAARENIEAAIQQLAGAAL
jgi:hypothetical protein